MKIKNKLLLGLSSKPIVIILLIVFGIFQINSLQKLELRTQNNFDSTLLAEQIQKSIKDEAISLRNLMIFKNQDSIQKEIAIVQTESDTVLQKITLLESKVTTTEQKKLVEKLKETNQEFNAYKEQVIQLVRNGKNEQAVGLIDDNGHSIHNEFLQGVYQITVNFENNMQTSFSKTTKDFQWQILITSLISIICLTISSGYMFQTIWKLMIRLSKVSTVMMNVATGKTDLSTKIEVISADELDDVAKSFNMMTESLEKQLVKEQSLTWIKSNMADITTNLSGTHNLETLSQTLLSKIVPLLGGSHAVVYGKDLDKVNEKSSFKFLASYAMDESGHHPKRIELGEGLIGQAALEKLPITLNEVPADYLRIRSGLGDASPLTLQIIPIIFEEEVKAILELASFQPFGANQQELLEEITGSLGIVFESAFSRIQLANLLEETQLLMEEVQAQSEELQTGQEELRVINEELEEQTQALRQSEQTLQSQQEELEHANKELKDKAESLEEQNELYELTNKKVELARAELEEKAKQLELSSKYKSEFLANMSHELRTPLNSLLILSKLLADNPEMNLTDKQVEYSRTIYSSGCDLLTLINDILDLAKIESGKMEVHPSRVLIRDLVEFVENRFRPIADDKKLGFTISLQTGLPESIYNDELRLQQVLKNLLSNAFKFTHHGEVTLEIGLSEFGHHPIFSFSVIDTGIGIPKDKQSLIFEAFQQADGTTSRRYGGTGLGLSICREISNLLNGDIAVESQEGKGSKFTFSVADFQDETKEQKLEQVNSLAEVAAAKNTIDDKPEGIVPKTQLLASKNHVDSKEENEIKRLLIVDDDLKQRNSLMELIGEMNVVIKAVSTASEAIEELKVNKFDFIVLDLGLTDMSGFDFLDRVKSNPRNDHLHVFIYTGRDLTSKEEIHLKKYTNTIIIKDEQSPQRLLAELELFLHSSDEKVDLHYQEKGVKENLQNELEGKRILLVDDDVRNVYALMSLLELYRMDITFAENGRECIEILEKDPSFDMILMDIMMPEMDGYEAIRRIRANPEFTSMPIIALTAKAMKEDRDQCMKAGASDYIVKPFDPDQLISLIMVWLYQKKQS